jgi:hypothetical protein
VTAFDPTVARRLTEGLLADVKRLPPTPVRARYQAIADQLQAALRMLPVVTAACVFREAFRDEDADCIQEHHDLLAAVDRYQEVTQ